MIDISNIRSFIDKDVYEKDIEEPTPLDVKSKLSLEVQELFVKDLVEEGIDNETIYLAWEIVEDVLGADEALNKGFLYRVLDYIELLESYYHKRQEKEND